MLLKRTLSLAELLGSETKRQIASKEDLFTATIRTSPRVHDFYWRDDGQSGVDLPSVAIPSFGDVESFYADVATFYPSMSPISAHMHVLGSEFSNLALTPEWSRTTKSIGLSAGEDLTRGVWISLAITEGASNAANNRPDTEVDVTYALCRRSLAFTLARARYLYPHYAPDKVAEKWILLRELSKMEFPPAVSASILWIAKVAMDQSPPTLGSQGQAPELAIMIRQLLDHSMSLPQFAEFLTVRNPAVANHLEILSGDYDGRMEGLMRIVSAVRMQGRGSELDAVTIGFFCNAILPGSLTYIRLLARLIGEYPSVLVWYGFFSGLSEGFDWRGAMSGIGQKLLRDITSPFSIEDQARCDIALEELAVVARVGITAGTIKSIQERTMLVSLLPGIDVFARLPIEGDAEGHRATQMPRRDDRDRQFGARDQQLRRLLSDAQQLLGSGNAFTTESHDSWPETSSRRKRGKTPR